MINNKNAGNFSQIPQMVIFYIQKDFFLVTLVIGCFYFILFISLLLSLQANLRFHSAVFFVFSFLISCLSKVLLFGLTLGLSATLPLNTGWSLIPISVNAKKLGMGGGAVGLLAPDHHCQSCWAHKTPVHEWGLTFTFSPPATTHQWVNILWRKTP